MKRCCYCELEKPRDEFYFSAARCGGYSAGCKECTKARERERHRNPRPKPVKKYADYLKEAGMDGYFKRLRAAQMLDEEAVKVKL